jgi:hypothetical protein
MTGSDFAGWWDQKVALHTRSLEQWVLDNPGMASVILATTAATAMDVSSGIVDVARLGEGVGAASGDDATAWDIARGLGTDALRLVSIIPIGRGVSMIVKVGVQRVAVRATLYCAVRGGLCAPIAGTQALRRSGQAVFMKLDDILLKTHGARYADLAADARTGMTLTKLAEVLRQHGARVTSAPVVKALADLPAAIRGNDVVILGIKWFNTLKKAESYHAIHAYLDHLGRLRFSDRTGHVVESLADLGRRAPGYHGIENATLVTGEQMLMVKGLKLLEVFDRIGFVHMFLAFTPQIIVNADQADPEMVVQSIEAKILREDKGIIPVKIPEAPVKPNVGKAGRPKIPPVEYLTGVKFRLNHLGYSAGPPVHVNDARCQAAVRAFQRDYRLEVDGIPGPRTQAKLREVCGY